MVNIIQDSRQPRYSTPHNVTPKIHRSRMLDKYREDLTTDNIENEIDVDTFKLNESPVFNNRNIDFIHSPFAINKNKVTSNHLRPVLGDHQSHVLANEFEIDTFKPRKSSLRSSSRSKSRKSSQASVTSTLTANSPMTNEALSMAQFRNITPLNFEDLERMMADDTPVSRGANRSTRSGEFQFKKPLSHQKRYSDDKVPMLYQHKTPSNSRSTSPVKQVASRQQQAVSLTPAQRVEKHAGRLFSNLSLEGKSALDQYEFKELLGKGASANVFRAINLITGVEVAVKQIEINAKDDIELMMTEIRLLKILKHNNIVKYHGYVNNGQTLNIILEYCSGGSLRKLYKQRKRGLEEDEIIKFTKEILKGLVYLHEQGVIHRDVKLANVLLTWDGTVKLADFGVSSRANHKSSLVVGGSPYWMAPEVILLQGSTTASDIWSLGATVVELFTTQPPYHEFDPMAACHAIGIEDNPPIPLNLPKLAKDFLIECFQKSPELRIDAKRLLQHPWLNDKISLKLRHVSRGRPTTQRQQPYTPQEPKQKVVSMPKYQDCDQLVLPKVRGRKSKSVEPKESKEQLIGPRSPYRESDEEPIDENDFENLDFTPLRQSSINRPKLESGYKSSSDQILSKFHEDDEKDSFLENDFDQLQLHHRNTTYTTIDEEDPFIEIEEGSDDFVDPKETKLVSTVETLVGKLEIKNDDLIDDLTKLNSIIKGNTAMGKVVVRNHGLIRLLELLSDKDTEVTEICLRLLNVVFLTNSQALENFCVIGGITSVVEFSNFRYPKRLRMEVVNFIELIINSNSSIFQMFIACGGLKILIKFVEEDIDSIPKLVSCGVDGIHLTFTTELPTSRSDFCYLLKDSVDWLAVNLSHFVNDETYADKIVTILQSFNYSEPRVKSYIATTTLFKSIFRNYSKFSHLNKLKILKFISSLSSVPANLNILDASNCLAFLVQELLSHPPPSTHYKEIANSICPTIFNLCHLNKIRQLDLVELDAIPIFAQLAQVELPFKDFIIPILSELVLINTKVRKILWENNVFNIFTGYLINPYWQLNSLDAIKNWLILDDKIEEELKRNLSRFIKGFQITLNLNFLQNFLELIGLNKNFSQLLCNSSLIDDLFTKLQNFKKNAIIELTLLRILKKIIIDNKNNEKLITQIKSKYNDFNVDEKSVLVVELIKEIDEIIKS